MTEANPCSHPLNDPALTDECGRCNKPFAPPPPCPPPGRVGFDPRRPDNDREIAPIPRRPAHGLRQGPRPAADRRGQQGLCEVHPGHCPVRFLPQVCVSRLLGWLQPRLPVLRGRCRGARGPADGRPSRVGPASVGPAAIGSATVGRDAGGCAPGGSTIGSPVHVGRVSVGCAFACRAFGGLDRPAPRRVEAAPSTRSSPRRPDEGCTGRGIRRRFRPACLRGWLPAAGAVDGIRGRDRLRQPGDTSSNRSERGRCGRDLHGQRDDRSERRPDRSRLVHDGTFSRSVEDSQLDFPSDSDR
jgi:hypothetical protein